MSSLTLRGGNFSDIGSGWRALPISGFRRQRDAAPPPNLDHYSWAELRSVVTVIVAPGVILLLAARGQVGFGKCVASLGFTKHDSRAIML